MANKKKKKPAANPARGFATTSAPSKSRETTGVDDASVSVPKDEGNSMISNGHGPETHSSANGTSQKKPDDPDVQNMTPEELEQHLEQAELHVLVDSHAARVKSDASRQVTRLRNERRQLRQIADRANISGLTDDFVEEIMAGEAVPLIVPAPRARLPTIDQSPSSDDMLLKMWTLYEVLQQMKMPSVDDALEHVLSTPLQRSLPPSDDYIYGLNEALVWYARVKQANELPNYDSGHIAEDRNGNEEDIDADMSDHEREHAKTKNEANTGEIKSDQQHEESSYESDIEDGISDVSEDDTDDPDQLIDRWVRLQVSKFYLGQRTRPPKAKSKKTTEVVVERIKAIERDMLFDGETAQQRWQPMLKDLQIEFGQTRMSAKKKKKQPASQTTEQSLDVKDDDDDDAMLGGMFGEEGDAITTQNAQGEDTVVILRDFGTWSGAHPRRLLEESSSTLLKRNGLKFKPLLTTSFSSRLQLDISWTARLKADELGRSCLPNGVILEQRASSWTFKMQGIATKTAQSSEALLATLALFLLSSANSINTKVLQRLPKVWRNLLADLEKARQNTVADEDAKKLQHVRSVIRTVDLGDATATEDSSNGSAGLQKRHYAQRNHFIRQSPEEALQSWKQRAHSPSFLKMQVHRQDLPIHQHKQNILDAFAANQILIVCADTGAGKSTQVPSYILENQLTSGKDYNIMVTQPRRISAISIARRVSTELGEGKDDLGTARSLIGYAIRMESKTSQNTRITFATTGVLLRMLQDSPGLEHLDCLVLDEVHERTMDLDLLFIALKRLRARGSALKIVLMSATVDATKFSAYFDQAPVLDIPGRTFPVEVGFLEDVVEETIDIQQSSGTATPEEDPSGVADSDEPEDRDDNSGGLEKYSAATKRFLLQYDATRIDYDIIVKLTTAIANKPKFVQYSHAILIFMPGIGEIRRLHNMIASAKTFSSGWVIHMLHSSFSTQELEQAFEVPRKGLRKIVIATNIAETGITIPDVTAVIDTCKEKVMRFDERRQLSRLTEGLIAKASARQRKGRAARVRNGLCFHLVTRHRFDTKMPEQATPEMLRLSLQEPILRVKIWNLGPIEEVLAAAIDPPSSKNVRRAAAKLRDIGAIDATENLTSLGSLLAKLPLDVALGKMAIYGVIFQCLDAIATIIATFSIKSIFVEKGSSQGSVYASFTRGESDFLTTYNAYLGWKKANKAGTGQQFCQKYHLNQFQLLQLEEQKTQVLLYLTDAGLLALATEESAALHRARYSKSRSSIFEVPARYDRLNSDTMVAAVVAIALYPKILKREGQGYRNVYTNQQLQLAPTSINRIASKPPNWLVYLEATQAKSGRLNAFHSSRITHAMLALLLGEADFNYFAGVIGIDNGRVRLALRNWKDIIALQHLRSQITRIVDNFLVRPDIALGSAEQRWLDVLAITFDGPPPSRVHATSS